MSRELFAREALSHLPKILTLLDRNPHSPTYGCFDRNFWHYRIIDFPSGMAQELVWPLALVYDSDIPGNPYYRKTVLRQWVEAGILFAARSAHPDGSCDDYYPFERAAGAAAFSLLACVESYQLLQLDHPSLLPFFEKRADWLASHQESGQLTNHQALIVLCLELLSRLLKTDKWDRAKAQRLEQILAWQSPEGWFMEYQGCDPGYQPLTISCLARLYGMSPEAGLREAIEKAVELAAHFIHPDGSYGGEYGSRNTYSFFPHGFELVGRWMPQALRLNDLFLVGLANGRAPCFADDHILGHHVWNYLLAWRDFVPDRPPSSPRPPGRVVLQEAGILIDRRQDTELYLALNKGGVFKLFRGDHLVASDTHISLQVRRRGRVRNAVAHLVDKYSVEIGEDEICIGGTLGWAKHRLLSPFNLMVSRLLMLTLGRFFPNLVRRLLQRMLILGKRDAPFRFTRRFEWREGRWRVTDSLRARSWEQVLSAGIGCDQTSIYVAMSRTFQAGQLQPWLDLTPRTKGLPAGEALHLEREL